MMLQWPHLMPAGHAPQKKLKCQRGFRHTASVDDETVLIWSSSVQLHLI